MATPPLSFWNCWSAASWRGNYVQHTATGATGSPPTRNSWFFKRDTEDACVIVTANWIARQSVWSMNCKINGELIDAYLSDNPWDAARAMVEHAIMGTVDPNITETIDPVVTAAVTDDAPPVVA